MAARGQDLACAERCCCAIFSLLLRAALLARGLLPPNKTCPLSGTTNKCHPQGLFFPARTNAKSNTPTLSAPSSRKTQVICRPPLSASKGAARRARPRLGTPTPNGSCTRDQHDGRSCTGSASRSPSSARSQRPDKGLRVYRRPAADRSSRPRDQLVTGCPRRRRASMLMAWA